MTFIDSGEGTYSKLSWWWGEAALSTLSQTGKHVASVVIGTHLAAVRIIRFKKLPMLREAER